MADIGAKIGLDGGKAFKDELKNITQEGKTLAAQMGALASSFTTAEDGEKALDSATKTLDAQIANQQKLVALLTDAVAKSTEAKGADATETLKLQEQLAKAETGLNNLTNSTAESALGIQELSADEKTAGAEAAEASKQTSAWTVALGQLLADAIKQGFTFMIDSLKSIVSYFAEAVTGAADYADEIMTLSSTTGMSTKSLQEYKYMADLVDVDLNTITGSMTKLEKSMGSAATGTGSAADTFKSLGIEVTNADGSLKSADEVFLEAIDALGGIENETQRDLVAMELFGKSAKDLNPIIDQGSEGIAAFAQEAQDMGAVLSDETLGKLSEVQDGFDRLGLAADSVKNQVGAAIGEFMLPYLNDLVSAIQDLIKSGDVDAFIDNISGMLSGLLAELAGVLPDVLKAGGEIVGKLVMGINDMLPDLVPAAVELISQLATFIIQNLPTIVNTAVEIILALVNGLAEQMPTLIPAAIQMIITIVDGLLSHIGDIISAALNLIDGIVTGLTSEEGLNKIIEAIPTLISSLLTGILNNLPKIIASGVNIIANLVIGLIQAIPKIVASIPQIFRAIVQAFREMDWSTIGNSVMDKIGTGVRQKAITIYQTVKDALNRAIEWLKNLGASAVKWGQDMLANFGRGIMNKANELLNKVRNVAANIKKFLGFSEPEKGPLSDFHKYGPDMMKLYAKGIEDNAWRVQDAVANAAGGMSVAAQAGQSMNLGGVSITVNAAEGQDANAIADMVMRKMQNAVNARKAVFA